MDNQYAQMVDLGLGEYITQVPSTRYPVYTRGNAGEVWPEVAYPLTITSVSYTHLTLPTKRIV